MKSIIAILTMMLSTSVLADYKMIVPQQVGNGTDVWARIVAKELEKKLGEKIIVENIPGINDIPGFNKFHNELQNDSKTIMVAHGGNAESFLIHEVDYNYYEYQPIGLQNLTIMLGHRKDADPYQKVKFSAGSGMNPDAMAITLLVCGYMKNMQDYLDCFNKKIVYVKGMGGSERRLAYMRGELNVTRESTAAYFKHPKKMEENVDWFNHGVLDINTGKIIDDKNFPGTSFETVYKQRWGSSPRGELYDAYILVKSYRDVLQKSLWVSKNNPNAKKIIKALTEMTADAESMSAIEKDTGKYEWIIGDDVSKALNFLESRTTKSTLQNLVWWNKNAFQQQSIYKDSIAR